MNLRHSIALFLGFFLSFDILAGDEVKASRPVELSTRGFIRLVQAPEGSAQAAPEPRRILLQKKSVK